MSLPAMSFALDDTMGAMMVGVMVAGALWGVSSAQTFFYFTHCQNDPYYFKLLVALVWTLDTVHQALISHSIYYYVITNFFDPKKLDSVTPSLVVEVEINAIVAFVVQSFFIWRIWKLSNKNYYISTLVAVVAAAGLVVSSVYVHKAFTLVGFHELKKVQTLSALINVFGATTDVLIAIVMVYLLHGARSGIQYTDSIINRLLMFVINTGLLTSICAVSSLIAVLLAPNRFIYICFFFTLGRLYTNSLLATLNGRESLRSRAPTTHSSISLKDAPGSAVPHAIRTRGLMGGVSHSQTTTGISINIESTTTRDIDIESIKHEGLDPSDRYHSEERY